MNNYGDLIRSISDGPVEQNPSQIKQNTSQNGNPTDLVCNMCGGDNIQERVWANVRTGEVMDSCDEDEYWCPDCEDYCDGISRGDYKCNEEDE